MLGRILDDVVSMLIGFVLFTVVLTGLVAVVAVITG